MSRKRRGPPPAPLPPLCQRCNAPITPAELEAGAACADQDACTRRCLGVAPRKRGPIEPGDAEASAWGFTSERWAPGSYLWINGDRVVLSFLLAHRQGWGAFRELVRGIEGAGFRVAVPTPLGDMPAILRRYGFTPHHEWFDEFEREAVEVWERPRGGP